MGRGTNAPCTGRNVVGVQGREGGGEGEEEEKEKRKAGMEAGIRQVTVGGLRGHVGSRWIRLDSFGREGAVERRWRGRGLLSAADEKERYGAQQHPHLPHPPGVSCCHVIAGFHELRGSFERKGEHGIRSKLDAEHCEASIQQQMHTLSLLQGKKHQDCSIARPRVVAEGTEDV